MLTRLVASFHAPVQLTRPVLGLELLLSPDFNAYLSQSSHCIAVPSLQQLTALYM